MNREELNEFLGKKVEITLDDNDVYIGFLALASDCEYYYSGDIMYLLIEETTHQPICLFRSNHVTKCTLVPELETDNESEK